LGKVEEPNGVQSCPNKANTEVLGLMILSSRIQARRSDGWLERMEEMFRLLTRVKLPSKSNSSLPVRDRSLAMSGHSKLTPTRAARALV
jgi:hypothetical protein